MISDDSELAHKVTASVSWLLNKLVQQSGEFTSVKWMLLPKNDNFNPELLCCIGDDSDDSTDSTFSVTEIKMTLLLVTNSKAPRNPQSSQQ